MKPVFNQTLGNIYGGHMVGFLILVGKNAFVHARPVVRKVIVVLKFFLDVTGIEHGKLGSFLQILTPHAANIAVSPDEDAEIAIKRMQFAN